MTTIHRLELTTFSVSIRTSTQSVPTRIFWVVHIFWFEKIGYPIWPSWSDVPTTYARRNWYREINAWVFALRIEYVLQKRKFNFRCILCFLCKNKSRSLIFIYDTYLLGYCHNRYFQRQLKTLLTFYQYTLLANWIFFIQFVLFSNAIT